MTGKVHAYVIAKSEVIGPDNLDVSGYPNQFWPGAILTEFEDYGWGITEQTYQVDEVLSFKVTLVKLAEGEVQKGGELVTFDDGYASVLTMLTLGGQRQVKAREIVSEFADELKKRLEPKLDGATTESVFEGIDALVRLQRG